MTNTVTKWRIGEESYSLEELYAIGRKQRDDNATSGMNQEGIDYLTESWVSALEEGYALPMGAVAVLRERLIGTSENEND